MSAVKDLNEILSLELGKRHIEGTHLPACITANLNPRFPLRPYQERAFKFFVNYWEEAFDGKLGIPVDRDRSFWFVVTGDSGSS
ncbi:MAG: hypothetical protein COW02_00675 [Comamonadaceae bacterium CG12_big_fil_rev_8_21_14_0_65_59_15]|nr:MAG: hypothetical protein COW02_00675 [Comamonadaceae bacterium CG12_big_fil_rev_8_21_14_0_65_59_15]